MNQTCRPSRCMHSLDNWSSKSLRWLKAIVHGWLYFENLVWLCLFTINMNEIINVLKGEWPWRSEMGIYDFSVSALQYVPPSVAFRPTSQRHGHVHWDIFGNNLPSKFFRLFRSFLCAGQCHSATLFPTLYDGNLLQCCLLSYGYLVLHRTVP
jgi:hypothetical protein